MPAPKGNRFALKAEEEKAGTNFPVTIRGTEKERQDWRRAAAGGKFNDWARQALNSAVKLPANPKKI